MLKCYGIDEEGDVVVRLPVCGHLVGYPVRDLERLPDTASLILKCPVGCEAMELVSQPKLLLAIAKEAR